MRIRENYNHTLYACYTGYITQAIVNNFIPLLFLTFQDTYGIPLSQITLLITVNFIVQLLVDLAATRFVDRIGYRASAVTAHVFAALGLIGIGVLPDVFPSPFAGLLVSVAFYAVGGGLIEVIVSPIVEACPTTRKAAAMSLLHSFYCWGSVFVVLLSTLFFAAAGIENWKIMALLWALIPIANTIYFTQVPVSALVEDGQGMSIRQLFSTKLFWIFCLLMVCAGASEQSMSQWASAFAESGLKVSKTLGDLAGPCLFSVLMGISRVFYAKFSEKIRLPKFMAASGVLCVASYLVAVFAPVPILGLMGCALCGLSVGIMWPGTFSLAAEACPKGGTAMFALAGDLGCSTGPSLEGSFPDSSTGFCRPDWLPQSCSRWLSLWDCCCFEETTVRKCKTAVTADIPFFGNISRHSCFFILPLYAGTIITLCRQLNANGMCTSSRLAQILSAQVTTQASLHVGIGPRGNICVKMIPRTFSSIPNCSSLAQAAAFGW